MNSVLRRLLCFMLAGAMLLSLSLSVHAEEEGFSTLRVGVAKADITGPINNISTGYNSIGDLMSGLLTRLNARAFVVDNGAFPLVYVSAELVHMTESIKPGVLAALKKDGYTCFSEENVMLAATHCHSSTSNTSWFALYDLINGVPGYDDESYRIIVQGIKNAIEEAYDSRTEGSVSLVTEEMGNDIGFSNRSADAFLQNHTAADYGYEINEDGSFSYETGLLAAMTAYNHEMAGLIFTDSTGRDLGFLSFIGCHGTSNGIDNTLVASDHSGYAALKVERSMGDGFVAAFAQSDSGDTSPNAVNQADYHQNFLRPIELGQVTDPIENQIYHGEREAAYALELLTAGERIPLTGTLDFNYTAVNFANIAVEIPYIGEDTMPYDDLSLGFVMTAEPCIGASIIAGDEEGAPVDNAEEGSVRHQFLWNEETQQYDRIAYDFSTIDLGGLEKLLGSLWPVGMKILRSDRYDDVQMEKVVCLAVSDLMQKAQPLQILRVGSLAIAGVPFELTSEQARRTRAVLEETLAEAGVEKVILATHANAYSQYVTTREEFAAQHYEGASCLFGPWSGAALTQELDKLAEGLVTGEKAGKGAEMLSRTPLALLYTPAAVADTPVDLSYGRKVADVGSSSFAPGEWVTASFTAARPRHITNLTLENSPLVVDYSYMEVQRLVDGQWETYLTDASPYTVFRYKAASLSSKNDIATVGWLIKGDTVAPGTYRLVYNGIAKSKTLVCKRGSLKSEIKVVYRPFTSASSKFDVIA